MKISRGKPHAGSSPVPDICADGGMVNALDLGSSEGNLLRVQISLRAYYNEII
jgi:hypothetical protein